MDGTYDVRFGTETVGSVRVQKQGLYYNFHCRCRLFTQEMYSLYLVGTGEPVRLGLLIPSDGCLILDTKLAVKRAGQGSHSFELRPRHEAMPENFIPLHPQEPFAYLKQLENAYLTNREGQLGIVIK